MAGRAELRVWAQLQGQYHRTNGRTDGRTDGWTEPTDGRKETTQRLHLPPDRERGGESFGASRSPRACPFCASCSAFRDARAKDVEEFVKTRRKGINDNGLQLQFGSTLIPSCVDRDTRSLTMIKKSLGDGTCGSSDRILNCMDFYSILSMLKSVASVVRK